MSSNETIQIEVRATWESVHTIEATAAQAAEIREAGNTERLDLVLAVEDIFPIGAGLTDWDISVPEVPDVE